MVYDRLSHPPLPVVLAAAAQHMGLMAVTLVFPLLIARAAGADASMQGHYMQLSMLAMGVGTLIQAWGGRLFGRVRIGSGFLLPAVFAAAYLPPALQVARTGGLEAVAGLTIAAGLSQIVLSRLIGRLRPYLSIEIVGLVVFMIGIILGIVAFRLITGIGQPQPLETRGTGTAILALAVMLGLSVWGGARIRNLAVLIGMGLGTIAYFGASLTMGLPFADGAAPLEVIEWPLIVPTFEATALPGFLVGALACTLRAFGDVVASQKAGDRDWRRPDYPNIEAGVLADGIGSVFAGVIGTMGINTYSASVGLSVVTGIRARRVALVAGAGWVVLAFLPGSATFVLAIPQGVLGAALLFASCFVVLAGISILGQRMLDARRTIVIGLGLLLWVSFDQMPAFYADNLPDLLRPVVTSSLVLGLLTALLLNAAFRIGSRTTRQFAWRPADGFAPLRDFLRESGEAGGVRADAMLRLVQLADEFSHAAPALAGASPVAVTTRMDEYRLEVSLSWTGTALEPGPQPSLEDHVDEDGVMNGVVLALMTRLADRLIRRRLPDGRHEILCVVEQ
ncbi:uracil-xanthine permease family protein [Tistrella mobilis]|uniref:Xanthine/uracil/vitamin C permease n=1 Tax=Tistrella mobilis (strain KA081020-065) TaxID=1110502 RepID=I3TKJ3_TISMK|nr:solute carrier family 23 protein [Tistrella mobilis]AFK53281.1 xanthine/uracil/vitamin C permease [Tistrella mobilis KA081020-065]